MRRTRVLLVALLMSGVLLTSMPADAAPPTNSQRPPMASLTSVVTTLEAALIANNWPAEQRLFFPTTAYVALKDIANPTADYVDRLLAFYRLDVLAYHAALTTTAHPEGEVAIASYAQWIPAGVCENRIGYWHMPAVRMLFRRAGRLFSVGIFSLISWQGRWYVIHLGPNPRPSSVGTLDAPLVGSPGAAGPPGSC